MTPMWFQRKSQLGISFARLAICLLSVSSLLPAQPRSPQAAPVPLFRDPVHDGAADPTLIWNGAAHQWWMFYTNRRADLPTEDPRDVSWVHGTAIGIASSRDRGNTWTYKGTAALPYGGKDYTFWAPDIVSWRGAYHMFVSVVPGIFKDWNAPREIVHFTSPDLQHWSLVSRLDLGSDRVIDPSLFHMPNGDWRLWYKDERDHSHIHYADSKDLLSWAPKGAAITDRSSEAPKVFRWKNSYWMITDAWKGLGVYRSQDLEHWTAQPDNLLAVAGTRPTDRSEGHHCDVVVGGDRAFLFYFTHQRGADLDRSLPYSARRSVLQVTELTENGGLLSADRDRPVSVDLPRRHEVGSSSANRTRPAPARKGVPIPGSAGRLAV